MITIPLFFRLRGAWLNPCSICSVQKADDKTLIVYLNNGRIAVQGEEADRLGQWIDAQATEVPRTRAGGRHG